MLTDRETEINEIVDSIITQDKWENNQRNHIKILFNKFNTELTKYIGVKTLEDYDNIKLGGYIRYVNINNELKWGGILVKKQIDINGQHIMLVRVNRNIFKVSYEKNYIFYKAHVSSNDKMRELFISYLDKDIYS